MTHPVLLREITPDDAVKWRALWLDYLSFYETILPETVIETSFSRLCDPEVTDYHGFLAELEGEPVGLVHYIYHRHGWHLDPVCYLQDLFCTPQARGHGVGRALIEAVYGAADRDGAASVYWLTQDHNLPARALYDQIADVTAFIKYARRSA